MTVDDAHRILEKIKELKMMLVRGQDFENASLMRDMEKEYLDKKVETK